MDRIYELAPSYDVPSSLLLAARKVGKLGVTEAAQQPVPPVLVNPNYGRRSAPATVIIDRIMRDRSSFIGDLAGTTEAQNG